MKMQDYPNFLHNQNYFYTHIKTINGIKFTPREIDIISCLLSGKGSKSIAKFLSIEEKTVETHKYNIMRKLECNSKEGIIEFIEKSDRFSALKQHYANLLSLAIFEKNLLKIRALIQNMTPTAMLVYSEKDLNANDINQLEKHLKLVGLQLVTDRRENHKALSHFLNHLSLQNVNHLLYFLPRPFITSITNGDSQSKLEIEELSLKAHNEKSQILFLFQTEETSEIPTELQNEKYIDIRKEDNYYFFVLKILETLFSKANLSPIVSDFKTHYETIHDPTKESSLLQAWSQINEFQDKEQSGNSIIKKSTRNKRIGIILGCGVLVSTIPLILLNHRLSSSNLYIQEKKAQPLKITRSDLSIPKEQILLKRPSLIKKIGESLKGREGIQTVALIGIGGAGKTTIARQYAQRQSYPIIWEINAETKGSLIGSFERLAYSLSQTDKELKKFRELQDINNSAQRAREIILFVKERIKQYSCWLLIFDNVKQFSSIQKYFPLDSSTWGTGKVIVTTRDANIQNNSHINQIINIGKLTHKEKESLFLSINNLGKDSQLSSTENERRQSFLHFLPPYPLDISIAAYYLKTTNVSYEKYLEHLQESTEAFDNVQKQILKNSNEYANTRYSIIALSLKQLIDTNANFKELLIMLSLLDSQNIPKDLLSALKDEVVVDNFLFHLKKYSLITAESQVSSNPTISIHRSTQAISLKFLTNYFNLTNEDQSLKNVGKAYENYLSIAIDEEDLLKMKSHCEVFLSHSNLLSNTAQGAARGALGAIYFYLGNYNKTKECMEKNLATLNTKNEENYPLIAKSLSYLGTTYRSIGNYGKAKKSLEASLNIYHKKLPQSLIRRAWLLAQIGILYRDLGQFNLAENFVRQSISLYKQQLPKKHTKNTWALATLATIFIESENFEDAKTILEKSLIVYQNHYSETNIRVAWINALLGIVYHRLGAIDKGKQILERSLTVYEKYLFNNHIESVRALRRLGNIYKDQGNYSKAESLFKLSLKKCDQNHGKNNIDVGLGLAYLAELYIVQRNLTTAEEYLVKSTSLLRQGNHPMLYIPLELTADLYEKKARNAEQKSNPHLANKYTAMALTSLQQALAIVRKSFSNKSPSKTRIHAKLVKLSATS